MSKTSSDDLFNLIHSLTKSEKRHFKIYVSRITSQDAKKFVLLFDQIESQREFDEDKLLKKCQGIKPAQLPNLKVHLYRQILVSVKLCNTAASMDVQIRELISYAQLLYTKCLYKQCIRMLDKAKKLAVLHDRDVLHLDILELEKTVLLQTVGSDNATRVRDLVRETKKLTKSIRHIQSLSNISLKLNAFYVRIGFIRNRADLEKVETFFIQVLPVYDEEKLSLYEKIYLYYCYTQYYYFIQNFGRVQQYAAKWVALLDASEEKIRNHLEMYLRGLNYLLMAQNKLMDYPAFLKTLRKLISVKRSRAFVHTEHINLLLFRTIYIHEINRHFMLGEFKAGTRIVGRLEKELNTFIPRLDQHYVLIFYYKISCLYFGAGNYRRALFWLNKIMNEASPGLRSDIASFARILALISHYELRNFDLLEYQVKSTFRYLSGNGNLGKFQNVILAFIRRVIHHPEEKNLIPEFEKLRVNLLRLKKDTYDSRAFVYFDIISWLESKIQGLPVEEVIQKKLKAGLPL
jgi:hypothetical protein